MAAIFSSGQVEPLAQHVDAHDDAALPRPQAPQRFLLLAPFQPAVEQHRCMLRGETGVDGKDGLCPRPVVRARHDKVPEAASEVGFEAVDRRAGDREVGLLPIEFVDRQEADGLEVALPPAPSAAGS